MFDLLLVVALRFAVGSAIGFGVIALVYRARVKSMWGPIVGGMMFVLAAPRSDWWIAVLGSCGAALLAGSFSQRRRAENQRPSSLGDSHS